MRCSQGMQRLQHAVCTFNSRSLRATIARAYSTEPSATGDGPSVSGSDADGPIYAACVIQRLPLLREPTPATHVEYLIDSRRRALEAGDLKDYPEVTIEGRAEAAKQQQQDLRTFNPVPTTTAADSSGDIRTMRRRLHESLYLVVRTRQAGTTASSPSSSPPQGQRPGGAGEATGDGGGWTFPSAAVGGEESVGDAAQRALSSCIGRSHPVFFVGNTPMAHLNAQPSGKTFFMLAQAVDDPWELSPPEGGPAQEFAWLTKAELTARGYLSDARLRELVRKML